MVSSSDVAAAAGLSQSTVSRAFRNLDNVAPDTRARILEVAERLGYLPNEAARHLLRRATGQIAVVIEDFINPTYGILVAELGKEISRYGYRMLIVMSDLADGELTPDMLSYLSMSDGVVFASAASRESTLNQSFMKYGKPAIFVLREINDPTAWSVQVDNRQGMGLLIEHLTGLGHRRIAMVGASDTLGSVNERTDSFVQVMREHGLAAGGCDIVYGSPTYEDGFELTKRILERPEAARPTAILAIDDITACGAVDAVLSQGLRVPDDIAVVGFDDVPIAQWPSYALTTVHIPYEELAHSAVDALHKRIASSSDTQLDVQRLIHPVNLVVRRSTTNLPST